MLLTLILAAALVGADQLFKALVTHFLAPDGAVTVIPHMLELRYYENTGAAFSILRGRQTLLIIVTAAALLVAAYILVFRRPKDRLEYIAILMIFSGGAGNLIDRIVNRYVVDYINLLFMNFAVFNFADCLVTVGFVLLVVAVFRSEWRNKKRKQAAVAPDPAAEMKDDAAPDGARKDPDAAGPAAQTCAEDETATKG